MVPILKIKNKNILIIYTNFKEISSKLAVSIANHLLTFHTGIFQNIVFAEILSINVRNVIT
jgi:hypothetical protein